MHPWLCSPEVSKFWNLAETTESKETDPVLVNEQGVDEGKSKC